MNRISKFLQYNNAVPLVISFLMLGSGAAFASTDAGQAAIGDTLVGTVKKVLSVDNTYIVNKALEDWSPVATVTEVKEDADTYYVTYTLATIDVVDSVWKDAVKTLSLTVTKEEIVKYESLTAYVQLQLKDVVNGEKDRLVRTQVIQAKNVTQKVVATEYTGLIGSVLTTETVVEEAYVPTPSTDVPAPPEQQAPAPIQPVQPVQQVAAVVDTTPAAPADTVPPSEDIQGNTDEQAQGDTQGSTETSATPEQSEGAAPQTDTPTDTPAESQLGSATQSQEGEQGTDSGASQPAATNTEEVVGVVVTADQTEVQTEITPQ